MRQKIAPLLLVAHRLLRPVLGGGRGLRIVLLHDTPAQELPALDALVGELRAAGRLVDPDQAAAWLENPNPNLPDPCLISFDDGFASNIAAARVLERHGTRGLFFVCPGLMDLPPAEQRRAIAANVFNGSRAEADLPAAMRLMTRDEVAALARAGHAIGNHTLSHRRLSALPAAECAAEIAGAAGLLAEFCPNPVQWFAFPFGDIDSVSAQVLAAAAPHHRFCRSGVRGPNGAGVHRLALRADHVDLNQAPSYRRLIVEGGLDSRYGDARRRLDGMAAAVR